MTISERIKKVRNGLTQKEFSIKIGVSYGAVQNWETYNQVPNGNALIKIREVYSVNLNWLLTGDGEPYANTQQPALPDQLGSSNVIELQHMALVRGFQDKQRALSINQKLMELEHLDAESFNHIEGYISGTVDSLRRIMKKMEGNKSQEQLTAEDAADSLSDRTAANR